MRLLPTVSEARRITYDLLTLALIVLTLLTLWTGFRVYRTVQTLDQIVGYALQSGQITLPQAPLVTPAPPEPSPEAPPGQLQ